MHKKIIKYLSLYLLLGLPAYGGEKDDSFLKDLQDIPATRNTLQYLGECCEGPMDSEIIKKRLFLSAPTVKISEVVKQIKFSEGKYDAIDIFGWHGILWDASIKAPGINVSAIAPNWYLQEENQKITIDLSGEDGQPHPKANNGADATDAQAATDGADGVCGNPGQSSGNFLGVFDKVTFPLYSVNFKLDGGTGGPGQDGGDGGIGSEGQDGDAHSLGLTNQNCERDGINLGIIHTESFFDYTGYRITAHGQAAKMPGKGGKGGREGKGGEGGKACIYTVDKNHLINGDNGANSLTVGLDGKSGQDVRPGHNAEAKYIIGHTNSTAKMLYVLSTPIPILGQAIVGGVHAGNAATRTPDYSRHGEIVYVDIDSEPSQPYPLKPQMIPMPPEREPINPVLCLQHYRKYHAKILKNTRNQSNKFIKSQSEVVFNFIKKIENNEDLKKKVLVKHFIQEALDLEELSFGLEDDSVFLPLYKSLQSRIEGYAPTISGKSQELNELNYVYQVVLSHITKINTSQEISFVIDVENYIETIQSVIDAWHTQERNKKIRELNESFNKRLYSQIQEAEECSHALNEKIIGSKEEIDSTIKDLLEEIKTLEEHALGNVRELKKKRQDLERLAPLKILFGGLNVVSQFLSFAGPQGALASGILNAGLNIASSYINSDQVMVPVGILPEALNKGALDFSQYVKKNQNNHQFQGKINKLDAALAGNALDLQINKEAQLNALEKDLEKRLQALSSNAEAEEGLPTPPLHLAHIGEELKLIIDKGQLEEKREQLSQDQGNKQKIEFVKNMARVCDAGVKLAQEIKNYNTEIDEVAQAITVEEENLEKLRQYEEGVRGIFNQSLEGFMEFIGDLATPGEEGHVLLDIHKLNIKEHLKKMKIYIQEFTQGFEASKKFQNLFDFLLDNFKTLMTIFDRIEDFKDQVRLAQYMANLQQDNTNETELLSELKRMININILLEKYQKVRVAVEQRFYPFQKKILQDHQNLEVYDKAFGNDVDKIAQALISKIQSIRNNIKLAESTITQWDNNLILFNYHNYQATANKVIAKWYGEDYPSEIKDLINGKTAFFNSVSENSMKDHPYLKFNALCLNIKHNDSELNEVLQKHFTGRKVFLKSFGKSSYYYDNKIRHRSNPIINLIHSLELNNSGYPIEVNATYYTLLQTPPMLSPYTKWAISLKSGLCIGDEDYQKLMKEIDKMEVQLVMKKGCYLTSSYEE